MTRAEWFRNRIQIILPKSEIVTYRDDLENTFTIIIVGEGDTVLIIGSPVVNTDVREWLSERDILQE